MHRGKVRINADITAPEVSVIGDGNTRNVMPTAEALHRDGVAHVVEGDHRDAHTGQHGEHGHVGVVTFEHTLDGDAMRRPVATVERPRAGVLREKPPCCDGLAEEREHGGGA
jgi:hypothetical protein